MPTPPFGSRHRAPGHVPSQAQACDWLCGFTRAVSASPCSVGSWRTCRFSPFRAPPDLRSPAPVHTRPVNLSWGPSLLGRATGLDLGAGSCFKCSLAGCLASAGLLPPSVGYRDENVVLKGVLGAGGAVLSASCLGPDRLGPWQLLLDVPIKSSERRPGRCL